MLGSDLLRVSLKPAALRSRLYGILRPMSISLAICCSAYAFVQILATFSGWLYETFFTYDTVRGTTQILLELPYSLKSTGNDFYMWIRDLVTGLPIGGGIYDSAFDALEDASFTGKLFIGPGLLFMLFFPVFLNLIFAVGASALLPGVILYPVVLLVTFTAINVYAAISTPALRMPRTRLLRRFFILLTCLGATAVSLPWAFQIGSRLQSMLSGYTWGQDTLYGEGDLAALERHLQFLASSSISAWIGALLPLCLAALLLLLGFRPLRMALGKLNGESFAKPRPDWLAPLVAEGTYRSLAYALEIIEKRPVLRFSPNGRDWGHSFHACWQKSREDSGPLRTPKLRQRATDCSGWPRIAPQA